MPLPTPPVLQRLCALGLTQTALAEYLGVTQAAVSLWVRGKRAFADPWRADAHALLAIVREHLAQGKPLATVPFVPIHLMNRGGLTRTGDDPPLSPTDVAELDKLQQELGALGADRFVTGMHLWGACRTTASLDEQLQHIAQTGNPSAEQLDSLRRLALGVVIHFDGLLQEKALAPAQEEARDAHQTP